MSEGKEIGLFDKLVISFATLASIVNLFKIGVSAAIVKCIFIIVFFYTARRLWYWIIHDQPPHHTQDHIHKLKIPSRWVGLTRLTQ